MPNTTFPDELCAHLNSLEGLHASTPDKYHTLEAWLAEELGIDEERITTVYLSDLSKQFTARVGASLISEPLVLVVLGSGDFERTNSQNISPLDRLARVCAYVGRIELILVGAVDEDSVWTVSFIVGPITSNLFEAAQAWLPNADPIPVVVPPL